MAIKLADTTRPNNYTNSDNPGTFPVAYAENVWLNDGTDLETFLADFEGNGGVQKEELPLASATEEGNIYQYIGATGTYTNGYFYKCVEDSGSYSWVNIQVQDAGAETIIDVNSVPVSGISNVIYRTTDLGGDTSYYAGNETASDTDQLAKYSDIQIIQVETLETASSALEGTIVQYIGATGSGLYNGYFYKCVEVETSQYDWVAWNVQEDDAVPHFTGTQAEYNAANQAGTIEEGTIVNITDDYIEGAAVVDVIENGNNGVPTSDAIYDAIGNAIRKTMVNRGSNAKTYVIQDMTAVPTTGGYMVTYHITGYVHDSDVEFEQSFITPLGYDTPFPVLCKSYTAINQIALYESGGEYTAYQIESGGVVDGVITGFATTI